MLKLSFRIVVLTIVVFLCSCASSDVTDVGHSTPHAHMPIKQYMYDPVQCNALQHQCGGNYSAWEKPSKREKTRRTEGGYVNSLPVLEPVGCTCER